MQRRPGNYYDRRVLRQTILEKNAGWEQKWGGGRAAASALLLFAVCTTAVRAGEPPTPRQLVNPWEVHDEVRLAAAAESVRGMFLSFRDYHDLVLFHPAFGYYSSGRVNFGPDFQTYPIALAPYFGQMVAEQLLRMWQGMRAAGSLQPAERFTVAEFGAGDGVLAESILEYVQRKAKDQQDPTVTAWRGFDEQLHYVCYDRSPALSKAQRKRNARFGDRFEAREADATDPAAAIARGSLKGVVLSNELPDAFAVDKVILGQEGEAELAFVVPSLASDRWKTLVKTLAGTVAEAVTEGDRLVRKALSEARQDRVYLSRTGFPALLEAMAQSKEYEALVQSLEFQELYLAVSEAPEVAAHLRRNASAYAREVAKLDKGVVTHINLGADQFIRGAGTILQAGYAITLDYGSNWEGLLEQTNTSHFRTYGPAHREVNANASVEGDSNQGVPELDTSDPYQGPTLNDMTTDVNFSLLAAEGSAVGLKTLYYGPQSALRTGTSISLPVSNDWSQTFETNGYYKLMVQQKAGTDPKYVFPQERKEPLETDPSTLSDVRRRRAGEIEKRLAGAQTGMSGK